MMKWLRPWLAIVAGIGALALLAVVVVAAPRLAGRWLQPQPFTGTAFSYQGYLEENGVAANGAYDFSVELVDNWGAVLAGPQFLGNIPVNDGVFVLTLDFGAAFQGQPTKLQIGVRPGDSSGPYQALSPLQPITAAPYAIRAHNSAASDMPAQLETIIGWNPIASPQAILPDMVIDTAGLPLLAFANPGNGVRLARCHDVTCRQHSVTRPQEMVDTVRQLRLRIGPDGLGRVAVLDRGHQVFYYACLDLLCSQVELVNEDVLDVNDLSASDIDWLFGSDGLPLFVATGTGQQLFAVHCLDIDCTSTEPAVLLPASGIVSRVRVTMGPLGYPFIAYQSEQSEGPVTGLQLCAARDCSASFAERLVNCPMGEGISLCGPPRLATGADGVVYLAVMQEAGRDSQFPPFARVGQCAWHFAGPPTGTPEMGCNPETLLYGEVRNHDSVLPTIPFDVALATKPDGGFVLVTNMENGSAPFLPTLGGGVWAIAGPPSGELPPAYPLAPLAGGTQLAAMIGSDGLPLVAYVDDDGYLRTLHCAHRSCAPHLR